MENSKKEKVIKILKRVGIGISLAFNFLFALALIIGSANVNKNKTQCALAESDIQEKVEFKQDNRKFVFYDDVNYTITFNVEELTNYSWHNFYNTYTSILENSIVSYEDIFAYFLYNSLSFSYYSEPEGEGSLEILDENSETVIKFIYDSELYALVYEEYYNNYSFIYSEGEWSDSLLIKFTNQYYSNIKSAIELDIQANSGNINDGIFETLTESTVGFIGVLGSGIVNMTAIFYDTANSQLTTIGLLSVIVVAVSLAYFLFRLLIGLIRMRG